jgi:hypothetical protein
MAILCSFKQNGIEGQFPWRVVASGLNWRSWFGVFDSQFYIYPVKPTTTTLQRRKI